MLSREYDFSESRKKKTSSIRMEGVPKSMFLSVIQFIYTDNFSIVHHSVEFFIHLLVYADYFMLPRMVDICSGYLKSYVNSKTAIDILLFAMAHNASQLEQLCIHYIAMNQREVLESPAYQRFLSRAQPRLLDTVMLKIQAEVSQCFI